MKKNKIIFTNKLINTLANSPYEINQEFLKEEFKKINPNFKFLHDKHFDKVGTYLNKFIDENHQTAFNFDDYSPSNKVNTDVAGIVIPLGHADKNTLWHIAYNGNVKGFSKNAQRFYDIQKNVHPTIKTNIIMKNFMNTFQIPVFESYKFLPGYRFDTQPVGKHISYEEFMPVVKAAYNVWLDKNFRQK